MCGWPSRDSNAAYAVAAFACDASTMLIAVGGRLGGVTLVHVWPPSRVTWINPVLVPTHITFAFALESPSAWIDPPCAGPLTVLPPAVALAGRVTPRGAARSGLTVRHVVPRSPDAITCCAAMLRVLPSDGNASDGPQTNRSSAVG